MSQERLIKKYANRRLYDASQSRHITLDDIRALIVKGEKLKVVEDKTGNDITRHILLQVIAEQEQFGRPILSTTVLESIIRF
jgi:polyhydroxyalkanoate synthesis repressor PhaR